MDALGKNVSSYAGWKTVRSENLYRFRINLAFCDVAFSTTRLAAFFPPSSCPKNMATFREDVSDLSFISLALCASLSVL
jgi:hypothetical protein